MQESKKKWKSHAQRMCLPALCSAWNPTASSGEYSPWIRRRTGNLIPRVNISRNENAEVKSISEERYASRSGETTCLVYWMLHFFSVYFSPYGNFFLTCSLQIINEWQSSYDWFISLSYIKYVRYSSFKYKYWKNTKNNVQQ